jgi:urease accessory protein
MSAVQAPEGWQAELRLQFARRGARTFLAHREHTGPLLIQRPFHPEPAACHAYIVHPPGGIVGGDELRLHVAVEQGAHVLLTTPAATKFYRSAGKVARQTQTFAVKQGTMEWLPQESIFYRDAIVRSSTQVRLSPGAKFIGWEIPCLGLPARNEDFDSGDLRLHFELWLDESPLLIDRLRIQGASAARTAAWGLAGHAAIGTLLAYPATRESVELVRSLSHTLPRSPGEGARPSSPQR